METIYKRRSIRKYTDKSVDKQKLLDIVKAGMNAPSAGDQRSWQFIIIDKRDLLNKIPEVHPYSTMLRHAPAAILVCGDLTKEKHEGFWVQDCSAATENMLLEITDLGLGAVWLGVYPRSERVEGLKKLLNLPYHIIPFSLIALGYPDEKKDKKNIFDESVVKYNGWG